MIKTLRKYVVFLMLLAFTSQIMAATVMTCELENIFKSVPKSIHDDQMNHSMHDHNMHAMHEDIANKLRDTTEKSPAKPHKSFCCKTMDHCLLGCVLIALNNNFIFDWEVTSSGVEDLYSSTLSNPFIPSPYRPPIFI